MVFHRFIIDTEGYWVKNKKSGKVSDCLIIGSFLERKKIAIVELKRGAADISEAAKKIQNVCNSIQELVRIDPSTNFDFYPIILSKFIAPMEARLLRFYRISLEHHSEKIIRGRCNVLLEYIFRKYA